jgi:hypothetical protein
MVHDQLHLALRQLNTTDKEARRGYILFYCYLRLKALYKGIDRGICGAIDMNCVHTHLKAFYTAEDHPVAFMRHIEIVVIIIVFLAGRKKH